ncbi:MAG: hypothetical protein ACHP79_00535 [Terriglobales bacterium]
MSASADNTLRVWKLESGREERTLAGHTSYVTGVTVTGDGRLAVSASGDKTLKVWELESGLCVATFTCDAATLCCAWADAQTVFAGDATGLVHLLRLEE